MRLREIAKSGHLPTLFSAFLYFDISFMVWMLFGVLGNYIADDFGLTLSQKGLIVALPILGGALVRIPLGILVDRIGPKRTGIIAQLLVIVPLITVFLWGRTLPAMLVSGLLLGVAGGSFSVALPLASRAYPPEHQGFVMGIAGAGNSGTVVAALIAPRLAEVVGWRNVFGLALIPVLLTLGLFLLLAKANPSQQTPQRPGSYLTLWRERDMLWFCLFYGFTFGGFVGLASFFGSFFHDQYGLTKVMAGNFTALCVFAGSFLRPVGGYLADRFGGTRMLTILFACVSFGLILVGMLPSLWPATTLLFFVMACLGMGNGSVFQLVPQRFRKEIGMATGMIGAAGGIGGFLLPAFMGFAKEQTGSYEIGFLSISLVGLACLIFLRLAQKQWRSSWLVPWVEGGVPS